MLSGPEESRLARAAADGDGSAFACLYEAYESRIFNYALRLLGDRHGAEDATQDAFIKVMAKLPDLDPEGLEFGRYLYTVTRNTAYDMIARRKRTEPAGAVPEEADDPLRSGPADLEADPERAALSGSQGAAVRAANRRLPQRQREVLALRELDELSYDEIAGLMGMNSNAVAQLISRARIGLRKEMQAGAAASVLASSPDCERAHGEMACRQDRQAGDGSWLDRHLTTCPNCLVASEEMAEAGVSYRAWAPVVPAAWLFREVMAKAAGITGFDWSEVDRPGPEAERTVSAQAASPRSGAGRGIALATLGSVLVAVVLATVLLAEADAPERNVAPAGTPTTEQTRAVRGEPARQLVKHRGGEQHSGKQNETDVEGSAVRPPERPVEASYVASPGPQQPSMPEKEVGADRSRPPISKQPAQPRQPKQPSEPKDPVTPGRPTEPVRPVEPVPPPQPEPEPDPQPPVTIKPCIPVAAGVPCR